MIATALTTVAYRVLVPRWSYAPTSGAGAAIHGGRVNRPGISALYLSLELETALAEYKQLDALMPPGVMVSYQVNINPVIDFRGGYGESWDPLWQDFYCNWRGLWYGSSPPIEPPSWLIGDYVLDKGAKGILFRSTVTGGTNVVLFNDALGPVDTLVVHDPNHALPKNPDSWN